MMLFRSIIFTILFVLIMLILGIVGLPLLCLPRRAVQAYALFTATMLGLAWRLVGIRYRIIGTPPPTPVIYAIKHQSAWEIFALYRAFNKPVPVFKHTMLYYPLVGLYMRKVGLAVNRTKGIESLNRLKKNLMAWLANGQSIMIFPEGTRSTLGQPSTYHSGVFMLYELSGLPVVPVALNSGLFFKSFHAIKDTGIITVELLPPIEPGLGRKAFMARLKNTIETATNALPGIAEETSVAETSVSQS